MLITDDMSKDETRKKISNEWNVSADTRKRWFILS